MLLDIPNLEWKEARIFKVLLAISYNRCRHHNTAEYLIRQLVESSTYVGELCILLSYSIIGYMHENDVESAKRVYYMYNDRIKSADNYGYFLRNASTAFSTAKTVEMLKEALALFEKTTDRFGYNSTLCNLGKAKCKLGNYSEAELDLSEAFEKLKLFGFHHLHVVLNNLGICKLLMGKIAEAETFLNRAIIFSSSAMPKLYCNINYALLLVFKTEVDAALKLMKNIEPEIEQFTFNRVKQKFYINYAMIAFAADIEKDEILQILQKAEQHLDRMYPDITIQRTTYIRNKISDGATYVKEDFPVLTDFCYMEYWYQNPLELLPASLLPQ